MSQLDVGNLALIMASAVVFMAWFGRAPRMIFLRRTVAKQGSERQSDSVRRAS